MSPILKPTRTPTHTHPAIASSTIEFAHLVCLSSLGLSGSLLFSCPLASFSLDSTFLPECRCKPGILTVICRGQNSEQDSFHTLTKDLLCGSCSPKQKVPALSRTQSGARKCVQVFLPSPLFSGNCTDESQTWTSSVNSFSNSIPTSLSAQ